MSFLHKPIDISSQISLKFVLKGPIVNKLTLVWVMVWCQTGDKLLPDYLGLHVMARGMRYIQ